MQAQPQQPMMPMPGQPMMPMPGQPMMPMPGQPMPGQPMAPLQAGSPVNNTINIQQAPAQGGGDAASAMMMQQQMMQQQMMQQQMMHQQMMMQQQQAAPAAAPVINITSTNTNTNENTNNNNNGGGGGGGGSAAPQSGIWKGEATMTPDCCVPGGKWTQELHMYFHAHHAVTGHSDSLEKMGDAGTNLWEIKDGRWEADGSIIFTFVTPQEKPFKVELNCAGGPTGKIIEGEWVGEQEPKFRGTYELTFQRAEDEAAVFSGTKKVRTKIENLEPECVIM